MLLSSHAMEADRIVAFEAGVDDFIAKPFFARELAARVKAILRRVEARASQRPHGALRLDPHTTAVEVDGKRVGLTPREFDILAALARSGGRVLNREEIIRQVWRSKIVDPRVVDAHVKAIRRKLGAAHHLLETVRGVGFRVASDERWGSGPVAWPGPVSCSTGGESG